MKKDNLAQRRERELRRYRSVVNATGDVKLARELRARSDDYIRKNYGITVKPKAPKLKTFSKETRYKKQLETRRYRYAIERGLKPEEALQYKKKSFKAIEEKARYYTPIQPPKTVRYSLKDAKDRIRNRRKARIDKWSAWSKKENRDSFPESIKRMAEKINLKKGFDVNAKFGYTVVFYSYIEMEPIKKWEDLIKADQLTEMAIYRTPMVLS